MNTDNFDEDLEPSFSRRGFLKVSGIALAMLTLPELFKGKAGGAEVDAAELKTVSLHSDKTNNIQPGTEQNIYSRKEAYRASGDQIVLHYGKKIRGVHQIEDILNRNGYKAVAYPGGPKGKVELFVGERIIRKYDQDQLDGGELGSHAKMMYDKRIKPSLPSPVAAR